MGTIGGILQHLVFSFEYMFESVESHFHHHAAADLLLNHT